jgi:ribonuclease P protein component
MKSNGVVFTRAQRITLKKDFSQVFSTGVRQTSGPLLMHTMKNTLGYPRLGLSVPRRVGTAVQRNQIKRKCREAFRHIQEEFSGVDIVLTVRPHFCLSTQEYASLMSKAILT